MTKPTILQVVPELTTGGAELSALEMARAIQDAGGRAIVVAHSGTMVEALKQTGAQYVSLNVASKNPAIIINNSRRLAQIIRDEKVDLVHARSRAPAWSAWLASKKTNIPFLATYHGAYSEKNAVKKWYNRVMVKGEITIANSLYVKQLICERYALDEAQVRTIYRGIDFESYDPAKVSNDDKAALLKQWKIQPDQDILLLAARLSPIKGHQVVVEAARLLKEKGKLGKAVFVFAGGSQGRVDYVDSLKGLIADYKLEPYFKFVGHVNDMATAYGLAKVSMSTSIVPETFGRTGAEAQAMECPIIATHLGGPKETCLTEPTVSAKENTGWLVQADAPEDLAKVFERVLEMTQQERQQVGRRARDFVLGKFPVTNMQRQTLEVYDELVGTKLAKHF